MIAGQGQSFSMTVPENRPPPRASILGVVGKLDLASQLGLPGRSPSQGLEEAHGKTATPIAWWTKIEPTYLSIYLSIQPSCPRALQGALLLAF